LVAPQVPLIEGELLGCSLPVLLLSVLSDDDRSLQCSDRKGIGYSGIGFLALAPISMAGFP
jgi:hypothetical protein